MRDNGVPRCPKCLSKRNYFIGQKVNSGELLQTRLCHPCNETFTWAFKLKEKKPVK